LVVVYVEELSLMLVDVVFWLVQIGLEVLFESDLVGWSEVFSCVLKFCKIEFFTFCKYSISIFTFHQLASFCSLSHFLNKSLETLFISAIKS